jgi:hypothetical protein
MDKEVHDISYLLVYERIFREHISTTKFSNVINEIFLKAALYVMISKTKSNQRS